MQTNARPEVLRENQIGKKKAYAQPVLKVYGSVRQFTQATGLSNGDGGQCMMSGTSAECL